jgi:glycerophosphoryl diester phosphodiesterase
MSFEWQGHRGCRGLYPENTIPAMLHAVDLGVTALEMDVVITKDKQVILSHEPYFHHHITTTPVNSFIKEDEYTKFNIYQMTHNQVSEFDVGMKPHPEFLQQKKIRVIKPLLSEVIDIVEAYTASRKLPFQFYNVEIKSGESTDELYHPSPSEFVELVMQVIKSKNVEGRSNILAFDIRALQYLHAKYPLIKTTLLVEDKANVKNDVSKLGFVPAIYSPDYKLVDQSVVTECKEMGMKIIPWTVNDIAEIKQLIEWGVDGIVTDYPNLAF